MKIQSKIYTSKATAIRLGFGEIGRAVCYPNDIEGIEMVEYTNLSDVWHDARKEKQPQESTFGLSLSCSARWQNQ